jgi:hypothetical protein
MRLLRKMLLGAILVGACVFICDYLYARFRRDPFGAVHIDRVLAVREKFNKITYERTDPVTERCVYSIFPHFGNSPCWYLKRHTMRFIDIG